MKLFISILIFLILITYITKSWIPIVTSSMLIFAIVCVGVLINKNTINTIIIDKSELPDEYIEQLEEIDNKMLN